MELYAPVFEHCVVYMRACIYCKDKREMYVETTKFGERFDDSVKPALCLKILCK